MEQLIQMLIQGALKQRLLVLLGVVLLAGLGFSALRKLPIDAYPDVASTQVLVVMKAAGMTPEEVEARVTAPIEVELLGIPHQTMLRSTTKYALTAITVDFDDDTDIYWARQQVTERLNGIAGDLPPGVEGGVAPMTTPLGEMFQFTIESKTMSIAEKRSLLDWVIRPALRTVAGVADINALGGLVRTFEVVPDASRLAARGVSLSMLREALETNNKNDGAGRLDEGEETLLVRAEGRVSSVDDIAGVIVKSTEGVLVTVADVADVRIGSLTRYGAVTRDGKGEAVEGLVLGLRGANARSVVDGVKSKLAELQPSLPAGTTIDVFYDRGDLVTRAVKTVSDALFEAVVLVLVLLLVFLADVRAAVTVALVLPLSVLSTFIVMQLTGMSANLMSLGGLAIALGMLVDGAVVVVENIVARLALEQGARRLPRLHVIYRATREVSVPVVAGVTIIVVVFLPLLTLQGLEGKLFRPVALTIMFALASSLLLSLTVIPVVASLLITKVSHEDPFFVRLLGRGYRWLLERALRRPRVVVVSAVVALLLTGVIYTRLGKTFMPAMDEGAIIVGIESLPSVSVDASAAIDTRIQKLLLAQVPEVVGIVGRLGSDELGLDPMGLNQTDTFLVLKPPHEWRMKTKEELIDAIRAVMSTVPGVAFSFTQPIEMRVDEMIIGVRGDLAVKVFGPELDVLNAKVSEVADVLRGIEGSEDVYFVDNGGVQYLRVAVDRDAAGRLGLSVDDLESSLRAQIEGADVGVVQEGLRRTPIILRGPGAVALSPSTLGDMPVTLDDGRSVAMSALAKIERTEGPVKIDRERGGRQMTVVSNVKGRDLVGFVDEARKAITEKVKLPEGYRFEWGGEFENQQRASARLAVVVPIALALIFLLLFSTFASVRQAVLVLANIPFALIGGVVALWVTGEYLSVPASVGFIALLGIAVLNGVVLVSYFNQLRAAGIDMERVVVDGAMRRLRPVMMTASITAFGLVPLLFASGPGSEVQRPLAIVVIGGLLTSTSLTLLLLPILYRRFAEGRPS